MFGHFYNKMVKKFLQFQNGGVLRLKRTINIVVYISYAKMQRHCEALIIAYISSRNRFTKNKQKKINIFM